MWRSCYVYTCESTRPNWLTSNVFMCRSFILSSYSITVLHFGKGGEERATFVWYSKINAPPELERPFYCRKIMPRKKSAQTLVSRMNNEIIEMQRLINLVVTTWHCKNQNTDNLSCNECVEQFNFNLKTKTKKKNSKFKMKREKYNAW